MENLRRDIKILKRFDYAFVAIAFIVVVGILYIGSQTSSLFGIQKHIDQIVQRMENHEGRLNKLESWHN